MRIRLALFAVLLIPIGGAAGQDSPPRVLVDKGACPFECCIYRTWTTTSSTRAFSAPSDNSEPILTIPVGTKVDAVTGEVHTIGGRFVVRQHHGQYKPGDELFVYTYLGEGSFKVWFRGKMYEEELGFSPYGGATGTRCSDPGHCWGELSADLKSVWWVKVKLPSGRVVWVSDTRNFAGKDGCS